MGAICCSETSSSGTNTTKVKQETETGINEDSRYVDASDTIYDYLCTVCERKGKDSKAVAFCKSCTKYYCVPCRDAHDKNHDDHEVYGTDRMGEWKRHRQGNMTYEVGGRNQKDNAYSDFQETNIMTYGVNDKNQETTSMSYEVSGRTPNKRANNDNQEISAMSYEVSGRTPNKKANNDNQETSSKSYEVSGRTPNKKANNDNQETTSMSYEVSGRTPNKKANNDNQEISSKSYKVSGRTRNKKANNDNQEISLLSYKVSGRNLNKKANNDNQETSIFANKNEPEIDFSSKNIDTQLSLLPSMDTSSIHVTVMESSCADGKIRHKDYVYEVENRNDNSIKENSDEKTCYVKSLCCLPNGKIIISDFQNSKVKLIDQNLSMISSCSLERHPLTVKSLEDEVVAVSYYHANEIVVFSVKNDIFVEIRNFHVDNLIVSFDILNSSFCVTTGKQLCLYTGKGKLIEVLHSEKMNNTVTDVAVNVSTEDIFLLNKKQSCVLTLNKEGEKQHDLSDKDLKYPAGICLDPITQTLFVCGLNSIIQLSSDGKEKLSTLETGCGHGLNHPCAVAFNSTTSQLLVAQKDSDDLVVFKLK